VTLSSYLRLWLSTGPSTSNVERLLAGIEFCITEVSNRPSAGIEVPELVAP
jgi:hypothetical protein